MKDKTDYCLLRHNTFGIDVRCRRFIEIETVDDALRLPAILGTADSPLLIIGAGSNLLLTRDFPGTVLHSSIHGLESFEGKDGSVTVRAGSGETWDSAVQTFIRQGWHGAENLSLIPGDVGATAVQNIGAYGAEASHIIYNVEAVEISSGRRMTLSADDCGYGYRQSRFKKEWRGRFFITHVTYRLQTTFTPLLDYGNIRDILSQRGITAPTAGELRQAIIDIRREKLPDPLVEGNAGSFFMNPVVSRDKYEALKAEYPLMPHYAADSGREKIPAGWLIEQCGWKGRTMGRAGVHSRQALVLVNRGGATGAEVVALCRAIQRDVMGKFGIEIVPEVNIV